MKATMYIYWANGCASAELEVNVNSYAELEEKFKKFCIEELGRLCPESFTIYVDDCDDEYNYDWDNQDLKRSEHLCDVWDEVSKDMEEYFADAFKEKTNG